MLYGGLEPAGLEVRAKGGSRVISGSFPYNSVAVLSDGGRRGRPRKEKFKPGAFAHSVASKTQEIHLLVGHDFNKVLASKAAGSLQLEDTRAGLNFEATLPPDVVETSHVRDALALLSAGLIAGVSPGFRIPPERTVPDAETIEEEDPAEGTALIRTISAAILFELSLVVRPAYSETQVEARNWQPTHQPIIRPNPYRWR